MYHGIAERQPELFCWTVVDIDSFQWQMNYVARNYQTVKSADLTEPKPDHLSNRVLITFDDGLLSVFTHAREILRKLKLPALLFALPTLSETKQRIWADRILARLACTPEQSIDLGSFDLGMIDLPEAQSERSQPISRLLDTLKSLSHDKREQVVNTLLTDTKPGENELEILSLFTLMSKEQILKLYSDNLFEIAGHTNNHPILSRMNDNKQHEEIEGCLRKLSEWNVNRAVCFAYPNGRSKDFNRESREILSRLGINNAFSTIDGMYDPGDDPMTIKRIGIGADCSNSEFKARLSGLYYTLHKMTSRSHD